MCRPRTKESVGLYYTVWHIDADSDTFDKFFLVVLQIRAVVVEVRLCKRIGCSY